MIADTLVVIPARGGSKGLPGKNIKPLQGKPLIHYTIEAALKFYKPEDIIVTTDSKEIQSVAEKAGIIIPFLRPAALASDTAGSYEVLLHTLSEMEKRGKVYSKLLLLQPTSPFRLPEHFIGINQALVDGTDMVVSVGKSKQNPYFSLFEEDASGFLKKSKQGYFERRQDVPECYFYNGSMYLMYVNNLKQRPLHQFNNIRKFYMDDLYCLDIDTHFDFAVCEMVLQQQLIQL